MKSNIRPTMTGENTAVYEWFVMSADDQRLAGGYSSTETGARQAAESAAYILLCIASNQDLKDALLALTAYVESYKWGSVWAGAPHGLCEAARSALASAPQKPAIT